MIKGYRYEKTCDLYDPVMRMRVILYGFISLDVVVTGRVS